MDDEKKEEEIINENPKDLIEKENNNENQKNLKYSKNNNFQNLKEEDPNTSDVIEDIEKIDESTNNEKVNANDESGFEYEGGNPYENSLTNKINEEKIPEKKKEEIKKSINDIKSSKIMNHEDKTKKENINPNQINKDLIPQNNYKTEIMPSLHNIANINIINQSPIKNLNAKSSDYDPQYEKYIEYPEDGDGQNLNEETIGKDSIKASGAQIANTIMGAGILSIPIIMRYLGLLLGIIFIIFLAFCTIYSVFILIRCHEITGKNGFSMLGKITMGKFGSILIKIIIIINNLGFCIAYFRIFGEVFQTIIQGYVSPDSFWANNWHNFIYIIFASFIMFYFIFIKNLSALKKVAYMGVSAVLVFTIGLTLLFFYKGVNHYLDSNISWKFLKPNCSFTEAFKMIPSVFLAFEFQFNVFPIYLSLKEKRRTAETPI